MGRQSEKATRPKGLGRGRVKKADPRSKNTRDYNKEDNNGTLAGTGSRDLADKIHKGSEGNETQVEDIRG